MSDFDFEPIRGLPAKPPAGETILWQGSPDWRTLARTRLCFARIAMYFVLLGAGAITLNIYDAAPAWELLGSLAGLALAAVGTLALVAFYARLAAQATVYTITNRRIVMRIGIALPTTFNIPFRTIASADLRRHSNDAGDIVLTFAGEDRIGWILLWPHAKPWRLSPAQPALVAIPEAERVASLLARALGAPARIETQAVEAEAPVRGGPQLVPAE